MKTVFNSLLISLHQKCQTFVCFLIAATTKPFFPNVISKLKLFFSFKFQEIHEVEWRFLGTRTGRRMDGWMGGVGRTDGWMGGRMGGYIDGWMNRRTDGWMDGWVDWENIVPIHRKADVILSVVLMFVIFGYFEKPLKL